MSVSLLFVGHFTHRWFVFGGQVLPSVGALLSVQWTSEVKSSGKEVDLSKGIQRHERIRVEGRSNPSLTLT